VNDCFYPYETLDPSDKKKGNVAYFGHKVLAVSYGGTLQLFGKKGATYASGCDSTPSCSGTSWVRLNGSLRPGAGSSLIVNGVVDWQKGDHIVVTTTDYLPGHSEELVISGPPVPSSSTTTIDFTNADGETTGVKWPHNGQIFDLTTTSYPNIKRLGLNITSADTRAAVALVMGRSIRIVSEGDKPDKPFPPEPTDGAPGYYFGGHTIVRQGFQSFQVQGVEFYQLGQGGSIMHYPVHFHMARQTPGVHGNTFVKDCSVWDSMTRWIAIHATQGVRLARNVGYKSIGHGYYLEDGTETGNQLYSNLGIFARAAVANRQNPRHVPGILTAHDPSCGGQKSCVPGYDNFPYYSDSNHPAVFWMMNGFNDFEYNLAAGAGTCGACYWFVPGAISGSSRTQKWFGYASEQRSVDAEAGFAERAGTTPLQTFVGNSCTSAMNAFQEVGNTALCNGVNFIDPVNVKPGSTLKMLASERAKENFPVNKTTDLYWPIIGGGGRLTTRCSGADQGMATADCSQAKICASGSTGNCDVVVLERFTTSFNWAQKNFSAIWMRPFWSLVIDSVISDNQSAGLNFVTSGDFSKASVIDGFWALARKSAFIGSTQWHNPKNDLSDNPLASNAGPFNPFTSKDEKVVAGLKCGPEPMGGLFNPLYCLDEKEGISMQLEAFNNFQRMFSLYDGPTYQDSNAYLNIQPTYLTSDGTVSGKALDNRHNGMACKPGLCSDTAPDCNPCATVGLKDSFLPGVRADNKNKLCYLPNAAIGWKQSNGFYYAPAFHSTNLFFDSVGIRHFVTEPLFTTGLLDFATNKAAVNEQYCFWTSDFFKNFTDIDRETVLNDDDGTLTGLTRPINKPDVPKPKSETISVNKEAFFDAPTETPECSSDLPLNATNDAKCPPNTAKTSPYEYVTASLYPECALTAPSPTKEMPLSACKLNNEVTWGSACSDSPVGSPILGCAGVPLYRQLIAKNEPVGLNQVKRMMGQNTFQRSALTVNNGLYYIDTTLSKARQEGAKAKSINVFTAKEKYDLFFLYANKNTTQTYQLFVGKDIPDSDNFEKNNVKFGYVDITTNRYKFGLATPPGLGKKEGDLPAGWDSKYNSSSGILTLTTNMLSLADDFDFTKPDSSPLGKERCQPPTMCSWTAKQCQCNPKSPYFKLCNQTNPENPAGPTVCSWSVKDIDCPAQGCPAFQIIFPDKKYFTAEDQNARPTPAVFNFAPNSNFNWNIGFNLEDSSISGAQCDYTRQGQPPLTCK
jgi:hypothetical protein